MNPNNENPPNPGEQDDDDSIIENDSSSEPEEQKEEIPKKDSPQSTSKMPLNIQTEKIISHVNNTSLPPQLDNPKSEHNRSKTQIEISSKKSLPKIKEVSPQEIELQVRDPMNNTEEKALNDNEIIKPSISEYPLDIETGYLLSEEKYTGIENVDLSEEKNLIEAKQRVIDAHPKHETKDGKIVSYPICGTNTRGIKCCHAADPISDLSVFGMGIVVYFQILKAFALTFFFITLFNIPLLIIYISNHTEKKIVSYEDALFKTTIGNVGALLFNCVNGRKDDLSNIPLKCNDYEINKITSFGVSKNSDDEKNNEHKCTMFSEDIQLSLLNNDDLLKEAQEALEYSYCPGKKGECFISFSSLPLEDNTKYYLVYTCYNNDIVFAKDTTFKRKYFPFIAVGIDILGGILLLIILMIIPCSHKVTKKYFKEKMIQISDYTLHIEDLNFKTANIYVDVSQLLEHLDNVIKIEKINPYNEVAPYEPYQAIYDFTYPIVTDGKIELVEKSNSLHKDKKKSNKKLLEMSEKIQHSKKHPRDIREMYVTFVNQKYKNQLIELYSRSKCSRCCLICCCQKKKIEHLYFRGRWLHLNKISEQPSNIIWENISYSPKKRCCRKTILWIISIIILLLPFGLAIGEHYAKNELNKKFNTNLDCTQIDASLNLVTETVNNNANLEEEELVKIPEIYCYCYNEAANSISGLNDVKIGERTICKKWKKLYMISLGLSIGIIVIVPVFNVIFSVLLDVLSKFQRDKTLSQYYTSYMIKSFILQLINTGIILIIANMIILKVKSWKEYFPFFTGQYQDMDPGWYATVGTSIAFSMILNIVTPHATPLCFCLWNKCQKCCDKCGSKETKCKTRKEYLNIYLGPQFNISARYASILTTIFITLMFSSGMPLLYGCAFMFLFITYWVDKWLLLRYYQYPPNIDLFLDTYCNVIILIGMVIHFAFGIWIYGNEKILSNDDPGWFGEIQDKLNDIFKSLTSSSNYFKNAFARVLYTHNIIMLIFLIFIVLIVIYRIFFWNCSTKKCCTCCTVNVNKIKTVDIYESVNVDKLYKIYNLRKARVNEINEKKEDPILIKKFLVDRIMKERGYIVRRILDTKGKGEESEILQELNNKLEEIEIDFDKEMPPIMEKRMKTYSKVRHSNQKEVVCKDENGKNEIRKITTIERDYTYHVIDNDNYQDFAYYYLYLNESRRYKDNGEISKKNTISKVETNQIDIVIDK